MSKPIVKIREAVLVGRVMDDDVVVYQGRLMGYTLDHPTLSNDGRHHAYTSPIQCIAGNKVETENTIYEVISWL